jgi:hypothetical protein
VDAKHGQAAVVEVDGKQAAKKALTVHLSAAGSAKACFANDKGKPLAKYQPQLWMLLPPGPHAVLPIAGATRGLNGRAVVRKGIDLLLTNGLAGSPPGQGMYFHDRIWWGKVDPQNYEKGPLTDADGKVTFPNLIAGATYRLTHLDGKAKDFKVEAGKTLDLDKLVIMEPAKPVDPKRDSRPIKVKVKVIKP